MANLYFSDELGRPNPGDLISVGGDEGRHAVRVSRLRVGEHTMVGDGRGLRVSGAVEAVDRDSFTLRVTNAELAPEPARKLVLVQALAKGDRDERAVEQATEFGVDGIIPWQAERSISRWDGDKTAKGVAKWARIAREASKQSMRARIPEVHQPMTTAALAAVDGHLLVLHPRGASRLSAWLPSDDRDVFLVVGPEGGLSDAELALLAGADDAADRNVVLLGPDVLRTSSAGPAALAVLNSVLGRW